MWPGFLEKICLLLTEGCKGLALLIQMGGWGMTRLRIHRVVLPCSRCALLIQLCAPSSSYVPFLPLLFSSYCAPILLMCSSLITVLPSSRCAPSHCTPLLLLCSPPAVLPSSQCAPLFPLCPLPLYFPTPVVLLSGCDPLLRCALLLLCSQDTSGCPIAGDARWPWRTCSPFLASLCPHYPASDIWTVLTVFLS